MVNPPPKKQSITDPVKVKEYQNPDRLLKKKFEIQLQGQFLMAIEDACRKRDENFKQLFTDVMTEFLMREEYLPDWWLSRKF